MIGEEIDYKYFITTLAVYVFSRCQKVGDLISFDHCAENGFDIAPDILERVKVMASSPPFVNHWFVRPWAPGEELNITRSDEEASLDEIAIAMVNALRWNFKAGEAVQLEIPPADISRDIRPGMHHYSSALWMIANSLSAMKFGYFLNDNSYLFTLNDEGNRMPEYWKYWSAENKNRRANRKELSKQQKRKLRKQGIIYLPKKW